MTYLEKMQYARQHGWCGDPACCAMETYLPRRRRPNPRLAALLPHPIPVPVTPLRQVIPRLPCTQPVYVFRPISKQQP